MSRIFEAVRLAREERSKNGLDRSEALGEMELPDRRIEPRLDLQIDLTVYGFTEGSGTFYEQGTAISGNANGGVFLLAIPVVEGQELLLINNGASQEQICKVVGVRIRDITTSEVSATFISPNQDFWRSVPQALKK